MAAETPLRALLVDDEPLALERLRMVAGAVRGLAVAGEASDGRSALALVERLAPDVVILDIAMPELDGVAMAALINRLERPPAIVFCTAHEDYALAAFEVAAVDYLLKPVTPERLQRAVERARERLGLRRPQALPAWLEEIWVPYRSEMVRLSVADLDRIEAERDYMRLHVGARSYLLHQTLSGLERRLDPGRFVRLHRSAIVRADAVVRLRHDGLGVWTAVLADSAEVRISRSCMAAAKRLLGPKGLGVSLD